MNRVLDVLAVLWLLVAFLAHLAAPSVMYVAWPPAMRPATPMMLLGSVAFALTVASTIRLASED